MPYGRALKPGSVVARDWHIERTLGQGGFGVTYEARHRASGARVALKEYMPSGLCTRIEGSTKVAPAQGPAGDVFRRGLGGFMKEAETLARLDHPSIVRVSGIFEANATAYMALAYETGGTLTDWLQRLGRGPTQAELDGLIWPLVDALIQVHSLPLLHRDIKPDNIMLRDDGTPVLIDFGAAKNLVSSESRSVQGPATLNFVTDGYAPPEQYVPDGEGLLGPWTDVYGLGATLYEAVTGARPASATRRLVDETHRPLASLPSEQIGSGWRPEFLAGTDRAMALKRSDRPQSMVEFRRSIGLGGKHPATPPSSTVQAPLRPAPGSVDEEKARPVTFDQLPGASTPLTPGRRSKAPVAIAAGLAAVLFAGGIWQIMRDRVLPADESVAVRGTAGFEPAERQRAATMARETIFMADSGACSQYCGKQAWCVHTIFLDGKCNLFDSIQSITRNEKASGEKPLIMFYTVSEESCRSYCRNDASCNSWSVIGSQCHAFAGLRSGKHRK